MVTLPTARANATGTATGTAIGTHAGAGAAPAAAGRRAEQRARRLSSLIRIGGLVAAAVVAVNTVTGGLPPTGAARTGVLVLTPVALLLWLVALRREVRDARLLVVSLLGTGLAGAWLDVLAPSGPGFILAFMAMAGIGLRLSPRVAVPTGAVVVLAAGLAEATTSAHPVGAALNIALGTGFLFLSSALAGVSRDAHLQARALLEQEEQTRVARERAAVLAERGRLARELHDVLAHTLAGLAVQLEGTRLLAESVGADPRLTEQVRNAQQLAREGMAGARRAVATLRGEAVPGPADLPELVEHARLAGLPATLRTHGAWRPMPAEHGLALYRTVQEALTNTTKYAGSGAVATVTVNWGADAVTVEVRDTGGDGAPAGLPSSGTGLRGLAERAALAGGRLTGGPAPGGWCVRLVMPLATPGREEPR